MARSAASVAAVMLLATAPAACAPAHSAGGRQAAHHTSPRPTATSAPPSPNPKGAATPPVVPAPVGDVSFVSAAHGWALTSGALYETADRGRHWVRTRLPATSVTQIRFVSATVGYAWQPQGPLWLTTDDARSWRRGGLDDVDSLEGTGMGVWAVAGSLPGGHVRWSQPASTVWADLGVTPNRGGTLLPHGDVAYVLGEQGAGPIPPSFDVYVGDRQTGNRSLPCERRGRYIPGSPMTVSTDGSLFLVCDVQLADESGSQLAYTSVDRGRSWTVVPPPPTTTGGVAAIRGVRFAWDRDLWVYRDARWRISLHGPTEPDGSSLAGFNLVGFQDDAHGLALTNAGQLYLTDDAGGSWQLTALPSRLPATVCRADQLSVQGGRQGGGFGIAHADIEITNVGSQSCALPSPSALAVLDPFGHRLSIETFDLEAAAGAGAVALVPHSRASLGLSWQNWCANEAGPLRVQVTIAGGAVIGGFDGPPDYDYWPTCIERHKLSMLQVLGGYRVQSP